MKLGPHLSSAVAAGAAQQPRSIGLLTSLLTSRGESHERDSQDRLLKGVERSRSDCLRSCCAHDVVSQPSSFILRFVQCCKCSNRVGSITTNRRPALPPASAQTTRPLAWITVSVSGNRKLTSTKPAKPAGSLTTSSPMPPVLRLTACTCNSLPAAFFSVTEMSTFERKNFCW